VGQIIYYGSAILVGIWYVIRNRLDVNIRHQFKYIVVPIKIGQIIWFFVSFSLIISEYFQNEVDQCSGGETIRGYILFLFVNGYFVLICLTPFLVLGPCLFCCYCCSTTNTHDFTERQTCNSNQTTFDSRNQESQRNVQSNSMITKYISNQISISIKGGVLSGVTLSCAAGLLR